MSIGSGLSNQGLLGSMGTLLGIGGGPSGVTSQMGNQGISPYQTDTTESEADRRTQQKLADLLAAQANGTAPSAAQSELSAGLSGAVQAQGAAAAGARYGQNAALRQRQVARTAGDLEAGASNQAVQTRAKEIASGEQDLGQVSGQMRGADLSQSELEQQAALNYQNLAAKLQMQEEQQQSNFAQGVVGGLLGGMGSSSATGATGGSGGGGPLSSMAGLMGAAEGGVYTRPTPVVVGDDGPEAVIPLSAKGARKLRAKDADKSPAAQLPLSRAIGSLVAKMRGTGDVTDVQIRAALLATAKGMA